MRKTGRRGIFLCSFSSGLDELSRKDQGDVVQVLRVLQACGRYSAFEASANDTIARTMTRLHHKGLTILRDGVRREYGLLIERVEPSEYPWVRVRLTEGGERLLADAGASGAKEG